MSLISKSGVQRKLAKGRKERQRFVEREISAGIAFQIRATRELQDLTHEDLAKLAGTSRQSISRLESPLYGRPSVSTLEKVAAALDVCLVVRLVPFSEAVDWVTSTPRLVQGQSPEAMAVPSYEAEEKRDARPVLRAKDLASR